MNLKGFKTTSGSNSGANRVPEYFESDGSSSRCGLCGMGVDKGQDRFCSDCGRGLLPADPPLFSSMNLIVMLSSIIAAQYLILRSTIEEGSSSSLEGMFITVLIMLIFTFFLNVIMIWKKYRNLLRPAILKGWATVIAPLVVPWSLVEIVSLDSGPVVMIIASSSLVISLGAFIIFVGILGRTSRSWSILTSVGSLLYYLGLVLSFSIEGPSGLWVLNGPYLMVIGLVICTFSSYRTVRAMDLPSSEGVPLAELFFTFLIVQITLLFGLWSGQGSGSFIGLIALCFLMLSVSIITMAARSMTEQIMSNSKRTVLDHIRRAEVLKRKKNLFYALQQIDLAIKKNPVDGFGRTHGADNPIYRLECMDHTKDFEYQTDPTVLALNEKGMTLSSQGLFAESTKQFLEATRRDPKYSGSYWNLATILFTTPGKRQEAKRYMDTMLTTKRSYMRRWMDRGVQTDHASWMVSMFDDYLKAMEVRSDILTDLTNKGDLWAYYRLVGDY